jgi:hypothetical protein
MESPQTEQEQFEKSEGRDFRGGALDRISALHGHVVARMMRQLLRRWPLAMPDA